MKTNSLWDKRPGGKKVERLGAVGVSECKYAEPEGLCQCTSVCMWVSAQA